MRIPKPRPPKVTYRQEDGDDGYCYCVRVDGVAVSYSSLTRTEAYHMRQRILAEWSERQRNKVFLGMEKNDE